MNQNVNTWYAEYLMCDPPPIGSWPKTHRLGTTVLDTQGSGHIRTKHTSYQTTNRIRYCCVRKHTSTKNSTTANITIQEKTWTDCQGKPQVSYSSECQGSRHVKTLLQAPGLGDCTKCALQTAPDNRTQLVDSRAQEKIKSTAPKAGAWRGSLLTYCCQLRAFRSKMINFAWQKGIRTEKKCLNQVL